MRPASGSTRYWDEGFLVVLETEGTGSPTVERQYAYGRGIDDVLVLFDKNGASYDVYYYLEAPLWTVEALVDETRRGRRPHLTRDDARRRLIQEVA